MLCCIQFHFNCYFNINFLGPLWLFQFFIKILMQKALHHHTQKIEEDCWRVWQSIWYGHASDISLALADDILCLHMLQKMNILQTDILSSLFHWINVDLKTTLDKRLWVWWYKSHVDAYFSYFFNVFLK